jgi:ABC-type branched-subunit amino acid transport system ATPase component/ABC-type branched-subunit amino acid transport system permease subunit
MATTLGAWITSQLVFDGAINGLLIGLLAMNIVLVYRSSRVINFAVGNMGLVGASLVALLTVNYGAPFWLALVGALLVGTSFAIAMELIVVRRLFEAPRVILLVATIGISGLALAIVTAYPQIEDFSAMYPVAIDRTWDDVVGLRISGAQLTIVVIVPIVALALGWFLNSTLIGRTVKASAENRDLARLQGVNPKIVSTGVWAMAGLLATLTMILVAGQSGSASDLPVLGPNTMVRALAAAVVASMVSFPRAMLAGLAIGVAQSLVNFNYIDQPGLIDALLFLAVLIAIALQSRGRAREEARTFAFTPKVREIPEQLRNVWWVRQLNVLVLGAVVTVAVVVPVIVSQPSRHLLYATVAAFGICALSLTVLTGWAGQLSLGQMAFAGIGALVAAAFTRGFDADLGIIHLQLEPWPFVVSILAAGLITAGLAVVIGTGALRIRGLLLAVSTFAFAVTAQQYLYRQEILSGGATSLVSFPRGSLLGLDLSSQRTYYWVVLAVLVVAVVVVSHLRRTGIGRTTLAVRDNADNAASYTIPTSSTKLRAFAIAGGLAGLGGALLAGAIESVPFTERYFLVNDSLQLVSIVVIGGIASPMGAVLGALWVVGLPAIFPDNDLVPLLTSSIGLLVLLLYFPGGLIQIAYTARDAFLAWAARHKVPTERRLGAPPLHRPARPPTELGVPALEVLHVRVRFGGIQALDGVSLRVEPDEIVGLIGTNGAGKSTLMNAIGGYVRASGSVRVHGHDVSRMGPVQRARAGVGRTFQGAHLFPELTVRETIEVALEARGRTRFLPSALFLPHAAARERRRRAEADDLIAFLGLGHYASARISDVSTGTRRIVELAALLALDARLLCLDEPTAGVAQRETEAFGPLIKEIRHELGAAVLVIEHDMPLIMGISDRVYCLEVGRIIAAGAPKTVRHDSRVIASYLGVDERAIARSGTSVLAGESLSASDVSARSSLNAFEHGR